MVMGTLQVPLSRIHKSVLKQGTLSEKYRGAILRLHSSIKHITLHITSKKGQDEWAVIFVHNIGGMFV
jgi:hypothetical protein